MSYCGVIHRVIHIAKMDLQILKNKYMVKFKENALDDLASQ